MFFLKHRRPFQVTGFLCCAGLPCVALNDTSWSSGQWQRCEGATLWTESATQTRILEPIGHIWVIWSCTQTDRSAVVVNLLFKTVQLHEKALKSSFVFLEGYIIWISLISVWCTGILTWDTFLSHDSSKHRKIKLRRLSMWHLKESYWRRNDNLDNEWTRHDWLR